MSGGTSGRCDRPRATGATRRTLSPMPRPIPPKLQRAREYQYQLDHESEPVFDVPASQGRAWPRGHDIVLRAQSARTWLQQLLDSLSLPLSQLWGCGGSSRLGYCGHAAVRAVPPPLSQASIAHRFRRLPLGEQRGADLTRPAGPTLDRPLSLPSLPRLCA